MADSYGRRDIIIQRLHGTVCLYKGEPHIVTDIEGDYVFLDPLNVEEGSKRVKYTEDVFSYKPFPLGYMLYRGGLSFLARRSSRQFKQGVTKSNISIRFNGINRGQVRSNWFQSEAFRRCILRPEFNKSMKDRLESFSGEDNKNPYLILSRDLSAQKEKRPSVIKLYYKTNEVAHYKEGLVCMSKEYRSPHNIMKKYLDNQGLRIR